MGFQWIDRITKCCIVNTRQLSANWNEWRKLCLNVGDVFNRWLCLNVGDVLNRWESNHMLCSFIMVFMIVELCNLLTIVQESCIDEYHWLILLAKGALRFIFSEMIVRVDWSSISARLYNPDHNVFNHASFLSPQSADLFKSIQYSYCKVRYTYRTL